jgi:hypothetical protein
MPAILQCLFCQGRCLYPNVHRPGHQVRRRSRRHYDRQSVDDLLEQVQVELTAAALIEAEHYAVQGAS